MSTHSSRTPLIDLFKGLACAAIVWHHLAFYGPMSDIAQPLAPQLIGWLYDHGRMAVQVFLVLAGYLAAASLAPDGHARFGHAGPVVARRFVRLVVPYAVALLLTVIVAALVRPLLSHPSVPGAPSLAQLVAHVLLLQGIVGQESLSAGVWYVAIDFQLYALAVGLLAGVRWLQARWHWAPATAARVGQALFLAGGVLALAVFNRHPVLDNWGIYFFGSYSLGVLAFWAVQSRRPWLWVAVMVGMVALALGLEFRARIALALVTALLLVAGLRSARIRAWPGIGPLVRLGQMSYPVFLVHFAVCMLVNAVVSHLWPHAPAINALGMLLAFGLSLWVGRMLYQRVECHVPTWSTALRWQAGLVGGGMLIALLGHAI